MMPRGRSWPTIFAGPRSRTRYRHAPTVAIARIAILRTSERCEFQALEGVTHNDHQVATTRSADSLRLLSGGMRASSRKRVSSSQLLRAYLTALAIGLLGAYWSLRSSSQACRRSMIGRDRALRSLVCASV